MGVEPVTATAQERPTFEHVAWPIPPRMCRYLAGTGPTQHAVMHSLGCVVAGWVLGLSAWATSMPQGSRQRATLAYIILHLSCQSWHTCMRVAARARLAVLSQGIHWLKSPCQCAACRAVLRQPHVGHDRCSPCCPELVAQASCTAMYQHAAGLQVSHAVGLSLHCLISEAYILPTILAPHCRQLPVIMPNGLSCEDTAQQCVSATISSCSQLAGTWSLVYKLQSSASCRPARPRLAASHQTRTALPDADVCLPADPKPKPSCPCMLTAGCIIRACIAIV